MANYAFAPQSMCDTSSSFKSCFPFTEMDFVNQYTELQSIILDNSNSNMIGICSNQDDGLSKKFANNINSNDCTGSLINPGPLGSVLVDGIQEPKTKSTKRKNTAASESSSGLSFEEKTLSKSNSGRGKRGKHTVQNSSTIGGEVHKPKEVIHVRARRGQATDSHSLAERVRREKINERMRCLQDLVPGCYKTMGMAVMLDEIINYVQSLQNQVEFLSMKLSAASACYDFNTGIGSADEMHQAARIGWEVRGQLGEKDGQVDLPNFTSTYSL